MQDYYGDTPESRLKAELNDSLARLNMSIKNIFEAHKQWWKAPYAHEDVRTDTNVLIREALDKCVIQIEDSTHFWTKTVPMKEDN